MLNCKFWLPLRATTAALWTCGEFYSSTCTFGWLHSRYNIYIDRNFLFGFRSKPSTSRRVCSGDSCYSMSTFLLGLGTRTALYHTTRSMAYFLCRYRILHRHVPYGVLEFSIYFRKTSHLFWFFRKWRQKIYCSGEYDLKSSPLCPMFRFPVFCLTNSSSLFK